MFYEPYGLLDPKALEIYIRSQSSCNAVARVIKMCFMQIGKFMNNLETVTEVNNVTINKVQEELGLSSFTKAKQLCNKILRGANLNSSDVPEGKLDVVKSILAENVTLTYKTPDGELLSDFQCKLVEYIDKNIMKIKRGKLRGIDVYMRVIDSSVISGSGDPNILGRNVSNIVNYQNCYPILSNLNVVSKTNMQIVWNEINSFKHDYLKENSVDDDGDIRNLIQMDDDLKHVLKLTSDTNALCGYYLEHYFKKFNHQYFNKLFGTHLSEIEMHNEFMDVLSKGLCGFNLNTDYFLDNMKESGVHFKKTKLRSQDLNNNANIKFITGPLYKMLTHELSVIDL